jgi:SAM-dependent methyltransferase
MKITKCYYCGSDHNTFFAEENGFSLVKCDSCGLLFMENLPEHAEIMEAHKQGKHSGVKELDVTGRFSPVKISQYLEVLKDLYSGDVDRINTWLDVGCGHGEFMVAVEKYSSGKIAVKGTEPNISKQESARTRGLDVSYFDIATHEGKYDVVSMLNVYSHLPDPPAFIQELKRLLNPNGELILETGDTASLPVKDHYRPFYLPDHISFASEKIVVGILEQQNFEILEIRKYPFMRRDLRSIAKELIKVFLPQYKSKLMYCFSKYRTDMFIRARLKNELPE